MNRRIQFIVSITTFIIILAGFSYLEISDQSKVLEKEIALWTGENEQVDDILVIGITL